MIPAPCLTSIHAFEGMAACTSTLAATATGAAPVNHARSPRRASAHLSPRKRPRQGLTYLEQRELDAFPEHIEALEAEQERLRARLADTALFHRDPAAFQTILERLTALETELPAAYARWEELELRQS